MCLCVCVCGRKKSRIFTTAKIKWTNVKYSGRSNRKRQQTTYVRNERKCPHTKILRATPSSVMREKWQACAKCSCRPSALALWQLQWHITAPRAAQHNAAECRSFVPSDFYWVSSVECKVQHIFCIRYTHTYTLLQICAILFQFHFHSSCWLQQQFISFRLNIWKACVCVLVWYVLCHFWRMPPSISYVSIVWLALFRAAPHYILTLIVIRFDCEAMTSPSASGWIVLQHFRARELGAINFSVFYYR